MNKSMIAVLLAGSMSLGACATNGGMGDNETLGDVGQGAAIGAVAGAGLGAVVGGLSPIQGAAIGAAVGGIAGAVWSDSDNDGYADGYVREGRYYQGSPSGYNAMATRYTPEQCRSVLGGAATGAAVGAVGGAGIGAVVGGLSPLAGAAIGAAVGGLAGAVYTDNNNDGCVDGYVREGRYYEGAPQPAYQAPATTYRSGERG